MWCVSLKCNCIYFKSFDIVIIEMLNKWLNFIWKKILYLEFIYIFNIGLYSYFFIMSFFSLENRYVFVFGNVM